MNITDIFQVYYADPHKLNSYEVFINNEPFLHCAVAKEHSAVGQTCHTSAVTFLNDGDRIFMRDVEPQRVYVVEQSKTFFGCVKLKGSKLI